MIQHHLPPGTLLPTLMPPQAMLATPAQRRADTLSKWPQAMHTAACAIGHGHANDSSLARLDDTTRTMAVLLIAILGGLGLKQPGAKIPLWLGAFSWLAAMPGVQWGLNTLFKQKIGFNLNEKYVGSSGEVRRLFLDPNYMPLQVMPLADQQTLADRLGIPSDRSDRLSLLESKLKQITVQAHTWWMLMAGLATPVLSAVICDTLENPVKGLISETKLRQLPRQLQTSALSGLDNTQVRRIAEKSIREVIASGSEMTALSRWWKQLPEHLLDALDLNGLHKNDFLKRTPERRFERLLDELTKALKSVNTASKVTAVLEEQQHHLNEILEPVETALWRPSKVTKALSETNRLIPLRHEAALARDSAEATLQHVRQLLTLARSKQAKTLLKEKLTHTTLADIDQLAHRAGQISKAISHAGGETGFNRVMGSFLQQRFSDAFTQTGANPKDLLLNALESRALRAQWWKGYPGIIGLGLVLVPSLLFTVFFLGKDPEKAGPV